MNLNWRANCWKSIIGIVGILAVAFNSFHLPLIGSDPMLHGDFGDGRLVILFLEHGFQFLTSNWIPSYWSAPWNYHPFNLTLAMSEPMAGNLLIYAPLRLFGLPADLAGRWWLLMTGSLNFITAFLVFRSLGAGLLGCLAGSYLLSFSMIRLNYMNHPHLFPNFPANFALVASIAAVRTDALGKQILLGAMAGTFLAWQFWCSLHLGWLACFAMFLTLAFAITLPSREPLIQLLRGRWQGVFAATVTFAMAFLPLYLKMVAFRSAVGHSRSYTEVKMYMLKSASYLMPSPSNEFYHWLFRLVAETVGGSGEKSAFMGFIPLSIVLITNVWILRKVARSGKFTGMFQTVAAASALGFLFVLLSCTRDIWGIQVWEIFYKYFPGADGIRAIGRISILQAYFIAVAVSFFVSKIEFSKWKILAPLLLGAIVFENFAPADHVFSIEAHRREVRAFAEAAEKSCAQDSEVMFCGSTCDHTFKLTAAMWHSMESRIPLINGYSGHIPPGYKLNAISSTSEIAEWLSENGKNIDASKICIIN